MNANDFCKLALSLPDAVQGSHQGHVDFRVNGRIFATVGVPDKEWGMVKLTPDQQSHFMETAPDTFVPCAGTWGKQGCTYLNLLLVKKAVVKSVLEIAHENIILQHAEPKRSKTKKHPP
ncbi:MAG: MmcQ/YjbR family DNA-binding protein [Pirellula sp.]